MEANEAVNESQEYALRFEDLTVDDDLPLLDRISRYCRSNIALQRLVHVKMLAETAETVGTKATIEAIIPLLPTLVADPESVIRQHLASQILAVSVVTMVTNVGYGKPYKLSQIMQDSNIPKVYDEEGYKAVTTSVVSHLNTLVTDADIDVRRSASDALAGLALHIKPDDIAAFILPIPMRLAHYQQKVSKKSNEQDAVHEELRITAANLLAELGGAGEKGSIPSSLVRESILPTVVSLCGDPGFRVRRAAAQALPRVLGGASYEDAKTKILPAFFSLSKDEIYRVRKSTGECLVDMSRSLIILGSRNDNIAAVGELRRNTLIPIAENLLADSNKFVRHGMMQFLGPFLASFYPFIDSALNSILPGSSESDGSNHCGIVAQFFPHASSMVSRLNSSSVATTSAPTPVLTSLDAVSQSLSEVERLKQALPPFVLANRSSVDSLKVVVNHRKIHSPDPADVESLKGKLLDYFVGLASVNTGDDNTDAEMRVYCAYSYPAVVLLLGPDNWEGRLKDCFVKLMKPGHGTDNENEMLPPLPVKRCLASSLHTVAHVLGPDTAAVDIMPIFREHFMHDTDESVRLNMIRNFPTLLALLRPSFRSQYLLQWCETIRGEEILGALKRSATNPLVLNWRQRDHVSRSLPDLIGTVDAVFVHTYLWPILKLVLNDSISLVREDAIWSIPILLKSFCPDNVAIDVDGGNSKAKELWSSSACREVVDWLKENILRIAPSRSGSKNGPGGKITANFSQRQLYCRICATMALAIRFGEGMHEDQLSELNAKFQRLVCDDEVQKDDWKPSGPYQGLSSTELSHLKGLLSNDMLPIALEFKDDRVTNVRLTLMKVLDLMPKDMSKIPAFVEAVQCLEEEVETWESYTGTQEQAATARPPVVAQVEKTYSSSGVATGSNGSGNGNLNNGSGDDERSNTGGSNENVAANDGKDRAKAAASSKDKKKSGVRKKKTEQRGVSSSAAGNVSMASI